MFVSLQPNINPKNHKKMARIYGLFGAMTGKLADTVMAVRNGEQIARKYQPIVSNPSTPAQVAQRAKLKLLSQLSAVMAPVIAMPRNGNMSSRNLFTKVNFPLTTFDSDTASIDLDHVQLTSSVVALPPVYTERTLSSFGASLLIPAGSPAPDFSRVVYTLFEKQSDQKLRYVTSVVVNEPGAGGAFPATLPIINNEAVVLVYGVRDNTEAARVVFGNLEAPTAVDIANLVTTRTLRESDITLSETRGVTSAAPNE